jgi:hypothetical protein
MISFSSLKDSIIYILFRIYFKFRYKGFPYESRTNPSEWQKGKLDFGTWERIFYGEFDGRRRKRALVKIIGE